MGISLAGCFFDVDSKALILTINLKIKPLAMLHMDNHAIDPVDPLSTIPEQFGIVGKWLGRSMDARGCIMR